VTDPQKRHAIGEFFTVPEPFLHPRTLVIGGCLVFLGLLSGLSGDQGFGLVVMGLGTLCALLLPVRVRPKAGEAANEAQYVSILRYPAARDRYRARESPEQVMDWLMEDTSRVMAESKDRLGLDETIRDPICVLGPLYSESVDGMEPHLVLRRRVPSGYLYSTYRISVFQFAETLLGAYQANFNLIHNLRTGESTGEFFYRDVVAVHTLTESSHQMLKSGEKLEQSKAFSLSLSNGDRIRVVIDDPAIRAGERLRSLGDEAANNIRAMVRQHKAPLQQAL
jgi:hypothetical protein